MRGLFPFSQDAYQQSVHTHAHTHTPAYGQAMCYAVHYDPGQARVVVAHERQQRWSILCIKSTDAQKLIKKKPWIVYFVGVLLKVNNGRPFVALVGQHIWHSTLCTAESSLLYAYYQKWYLLSVVHLLWTYNLLLLCVLVGKGAKNNTAGFGVVAIG